MPDKNKILKERLIRNLRIGLRAESSDQNELHKDNYSVTGWAGKSKTLGKYQFVSSIWLPKIKAFAKKNGYGEVNENKFLSNPTLQEDFFEHYVNDTLYEPARKLYDKYGSKANLTLDKIAYGLHYGCVS